jgi:predicted nuclease of predicted toxin-antitoxin system
LEERRFLLSEDLKLLLDESLGIKVYEKLKSMNFNVQSVIAERRGIKDMEVVTMAKLHNKVIATMDKDFGYLALSYSPPGVILLRLRDPRVSNRIRVLLRVMELREKLYGFLTVATDTEIRRRPLELDLKE